MLPQILRPLGHNSGPHSQAGRTKVPPYLNMFQYPGDKGQGWAPPVEGIHCLTITAGIAGVTVWQLHIMMVSNLSTVCGDPENVQHEDLNTNPHHQYGLNNLQTDFFLFGNLFWFQVNLMSKILTASTDFPLLFTSNILVIGEPIHSCAP